ncbi:MAG: ribonuclease D [Planctomycetota bacterium]|jgi:ribonuclease D
MTTEELPPPILIEDQSAFDDMMSRVRGHRELAVDTEADSFYSYREKVCLIQLTAGDDDYLIDPLAGFDLSAFGEILADPDCIKVFHDGEYDVVIMKREYGFEFASLFDTRVAAACLGSSTPGLASVLNEAFDVEVDKAMQRSDWAQRPLSDEQVRYARLDTHYLLDLMHIQRRNLRERDREMIVESECRRLEALDVRPASFRGDDFVKTKGVRDLSPRGRRVVRELYILRDEMANEWDSPPFRVMSNHVLLELGSRAPQSMDSLLSIKGFTPKMGRRLAKPVLNTIREAREMEPIAQLPSLPKRDGTAGLDEVQVELFDRLKTWRKGQAERMSVESSYLLNRHVMNRIAAVQPQTIDELSDIEGVLDWQVDRFGDALQQLLETFEADRVDGKLGKRRGWRR